MPILRISVMVILLVGSVLVQVTALQSIQLFGAAPDLVLLVVILGGIWLQPEVAVGFGFVGGLLIDLLGLAPLGLSALSFTVAAYLTVRIREYFSYGLPIEALLLGFVTLVGLGTNALVGTLFGEGTLGNPDLVRTLVLVPIYNALLALIAIPLASRLYLGLGNPGYR